MEVGEGGCAKEGPWIWGGRIVDRGVLVLLLVVIIALVLGLDLMLVGISDEGGLRTV